MIKFNKKDIIIEQFKFIIFCFKNKKDFIQLINFIIFNFLTFFRSRFYKIYRDVAKKKNIIYFNKSFYLNFEFDNRFGYFYALKNKYHQVDLICKFLQSKKIKSLNKKSLVELGCGQGINLSIIQKLNFKKIIGYDINKEHINFGKKFYKNKFNLYKADVCSKKFFSKKKFDYLITLNFLSFVDIKKQIFFLRSAKKISNKIILIENSYQRKLKRKKHFYDSLMKEKFKIFRKKIYHPDKIVCLFYYNFDK